MHDQSKPLHMPLKTFDTRHEFCRILHCEALTKFSPTGHYLKKGYEDNAEKQQPNSTPRNWTNQKAKE